MQLLDQYGYDVLETVGLNRDHAKAEHAAIVYSGTGLHPVVDETDTLTLRIANNAVNSAVIAIDLYFLTGAA